MDLLPKRFIGTGVFIDEGTGLDTGEYAYVALVMDDPAPGEGWISTPYFDELQGLLDHLLEDAALPADEQYYHAAKTSFDPPPGQFQFDAGTRLRYDALQLSEIYVAQRVLKLP